MLLLRFGDSWCYKTEEMEDYSKMKMLSYKIIKATVSYGKKNTDDTVAFLLQSAEMLICFVLFQQIVICEVVDAHGVTNIVQCFGGGLSGSGTAFFRMSYTSGRFFSHILRRLRIGSSSDWMTLFRNFFTFTSPRPPRW